MCGHVGLAGKLEYKHEAVVKKLLLLDYWRGQDSTGLAAIRKSGEIQISKIASHPLDLFDMTKFKSVLSAYSSKAFIGHNRAATKGVVNNVNAHPYTFGDVVGAHNGTLTEASWKALEEALGEKTGTDSAAVIGCIDKIGIEETVKLMQGAWALVWFDRRDNTLNFLRNKERPFWYAYGKDFDQVYWASEYWMISAATAKTSTYDYPLFVDKDGHSYYQAQENWHYRFDLDELSKGGDKPKPKVRELLGKEPEPVKAKDTFPRQVAHGCPGVTNTTTASKTSTDNKPKKHLLQLSTQIGNVGGDYMSPDAVEEIIRYGCNWCREDIDVNEQGIIIFEAEQRAICSCCSGAKHNRIYAHPDKLDAYVQTHNIKIAA